MLWDISKDTFWSNSHRQVFLDKTTKWRFLETDGMAKKKNWRLVEVEIYNFKPQHQSWLRQSEDSYQWAIEDSPFFFSNFPCIQFRDLNKFSRFWSIKNKYKRLLWWSYSTIWSAAIWSIYIYSTYIEYNLTNFLKHAQWEMN